MVRIVESVEVPTSRPSANLLLWYHLNNDCYDQPGGEGVTTTIGLHWSTPIAQRAVLLNFHSTYDDHNRKRGRIDFPCCPPMLSGIGIAVCDCSHRPLLSIDIDWIPLCGWYVGRWKFPHRRQCSESRALNSLETIAHMNTLLVRIEWINKNQRNVWSGYYSLNLFQKICRYLWVVYPVYVEWINWNSKRELVEFHFNHYCHNRRLTNIGCYYWSVVTEKYIYIIPVAQPWGGLGVNLPPRAIFLKNYQLLFKFTTDINKSELRTDLV